jgi:hypothetical protein
MRAFIEKDRHVEGCWTSYSSSLERPVLKNVRALEYPPALQRSEEIADSAVAAAVPAPRPAVPAAPSPPIARPAQPLASPPAPAQPLPRPVAPGQPVAGSAPPPAARRPMPPAPPFTASPSLFGEKLMGALKQDKENS